MNDITTMMILSYLNNQKHNLFSNVDIVRRNEKYLKYISLYFCYKGTDVEIRVYNSNFIKIITNNFSEICDTVSSVRNSIDKIEYTGR